jgi:hypothetical protein
LIALLLGQGTATAAVGPPRQPEFLQVAGGEEAWHPDNDFRLDWTNPPPTLSAFKAVHLQIWNAANAVVVPNTTIEPVVSTLQHIRVPDIPGIYTAEVWLEDTVGNQGAPAAAKLRFDSVRPGSIEPLTPLGWIGRTALPYVARLSRPAGPLPLSGIRGYAVSVDSNPIGNPCAASDRCTDAETDLASGPEANSIALGGLHDGTSYLHAVAVSNSGLKSAASGNAVIHVDTTDPVTTLSGTPNAWTNHAVALIANATDTASGMQTAGPGGPFTAIRIDEAAPTIAPGNTVSAAVIDEGAHTVAYYARDAAGNVNDGSAGNGVANRPPSMTTVRLDRGAPAVAFLNAQSPADPERIEARLSDLLAGPDPSKGRIAVRRGGSGELFEPLPTEFSGGRLLADWDSDAYPPGEYEFRATGYDTAGNSATTSRRADGTSMVLPNPLKIPTAIQSGFGGKVLIWHRCRHSGGRRHCRRQVIAGFDRRPQLRLVPYGKGLLFSGRLSAAGGSALAGLPVQVSERFNSGSDQAERVTTVQTGVSGIFVARLAPGPSRQVSATFLGTRTLTRSSDDPVRLGVRSGVRMRSSTAVATIGGRPVIFSGRIEAGEAAIPSDGKSIQLQFRLPGLPWSEFRTIVTDAGGRFSYAYRFTDDDSRGVRFEFRAFAPAQSGWPYEPAASRPVAVRGR